MFTQTAPAAMTATECATAVASTRSGSAADEPLRAVLFDMDGTLTDTETVWTVAFHRMAGELGGRLSAEGRADMVGLPFATVVDMLLDETGARADASRTGRRLLDIVAELLLAGVPWQPGAEELLAAVRAAGLRTALVTSSPRRLVHIALDTLGADRFDVTVCGDEVVHGKPDPEPYLTAMARLRVDAEHCVAVEDSSCGARAAERAGLPVLVVPSGSSVPPSPARTTLAGLDDASVGLLTDIRLAFNPPGLVAV